MMEMNERDDPMWKRRNQRGQEMVELGIVLLFFLTLVGGIMLFGQAFMVANMITHAARDGARLAASWTNRGTCGALNTADAGPSGPLVKAVNDRIRTVSAQTFTVTITQSPAVSATTPCAAAPEPTVVVNVQGCVPFIFNMFGFGSVGCPNGMAVNRNVTFDDELRGTFGG
jgi:Flp pilus assembly protein TadG